MAARKQRRRRRNPRARRARGRRRLRKNPSSKALIAAVIGLALGGAAWHLYVQSTTGQGTNVRDPRFIGAVGAGGAIGYLVGKHGK